MSPLTVLITYELRDSADAFRAAIQGMARRVEREGERGVVGYRFFVNEERNEARAIVDYASSEAWIGHHEISMDWPEMKALHAAASLAKVIFLGEPSEEITAWLGRTSIQAQVQTGFAFADGFTRQV